MYQSILNVTQLYCKPIVWFLPIFSLPLLSRSVRVVSWSPETETVVLKPPVLDDIFNIWQLNAVCNTYMYYKFNLSWLSSFRLSCYLSTVLFVCLVLIFFNHLVIIFSVVYTYLEEQMSHKFVPLPMQSKSGATMGCEMCGILNIPGMLIEKCPLGKWNEL